MATVTSSKRHLLVTSDTYTSNGDVTVGGDLFVNGSQTVINTATLDVEDKNITLNYGGNEASSQGAGITIAGSNATFVWDEANTRWSLSDGFVVSGDISASNLSGTNTGDQVLPTDFVSKANGGTFDGSVRFDGGVVVDTNTNTNTLNVSRSGSSNSQVMKIGVTDTQAIFNYIEDTSAEGNGNFGQYIFKLGGNDGETTVSALTITKTGISAPNLSGTNTGDQVLPTDFVSKANGGTFSGDVTVNGDLLLGNTAQDPKKVIISQIGVDNSETSSLMLDGNGAVVLRNLGSGAFASTPTDFVSAANGGTFSGTITTSGGITGLTLTNGISGNNFNITGVNQLEINDPGEGIVFKSGSSGDISLAIVDDSSDNILRLNGTGAKLQVGSNEVYHEGHKPTYTELGSMAYTNLTGAPTIPSGSQLVRVLNNQDYIASGGTSGDYRDNYGAGVTVYEGYNTGSNRPFTYDTTAQFMSNTNQGFELAIDWVSASTTPLKIRSLRDCCQGWNPWTNVWTSHNFTLGTGGGLDADKVDGKHASDFVSLTGTQTITGVKTFNSLNIDGNSTFIGSVNVGAASDGASRVLYLHGSTVNKVSTLKTTNGNLHIDSEDGHSLYLNYYEGASTNIYFGTGNGGYCGTVSSAGVLRMAGDVVAYYSFSDRRLKTNIKKTENNLDKILSLNPVEYTWKEGPREGVKEIGLIAQEVEEVVPEVVRLQSRHHDEKTEGEEYKQVDYEHLVSTLIGAMQEQQKQIDELKSQMAIYNAKSCKCKK